MFLWDSGQKNVPSISGLKHSMELWLKPFNMMPVFTDIESFRIICHKTVAVKYRGLIEIIPHFRLEKLSSALKSAMTLCITRSK